eukprot:TRINITY_DN26712_c0_g1_i1.p1 TRINITY_DN26712_c0_g1~~TRINITY_DN26712_c0_g1_i1.p1  ORF type:complete len:211 (-),score=11.80 TRINITY_DN26712_c0_g1_i1:163-795(-)
MLAGRRLLLSKNSSFWSKVTEEMSKRNPLTPEALRKASATTEGIMKQVRDGSERLTQNVRSGLDSVGKQTSAKRQGAEEWVRNARDSANFKAKGESHLLKEPTRWTSVKTAPVIVKAYIMTIRKWEASLRTEVARLCEQRGAQVISVSLVPLDDSENEQDLQMLTVIPMTQNRQQINIIIRDAHEACNMTRSAAGAFGATVKNFKVRSVT